MGGTNLFAQTTTTSCENIGCSDDEPECVASVGSYSCDADPGDSQCSHIECDDGAGDKDEN